MYVGMQPGSAQDAALDKLFAAAHLSKCSDEDGSKYLAQDSVEEDRHSQLSEVRKKLSSALERIVKI